jgi:glycosyltransferase involved in cell wall biosynthesis
MGRVDVSGLARGHVTKISLSANTDWYLFNFRLSLARAVRETGANVLLVSPDGPYVSRIQGTGFRWHELKISRRGVNPIRELTTLASYFALYRRERADLVHHFTIKPVLYGSLAARLSGVPAVVNSVTGLGYVFINPSKTAAFMRLLVMPIFRQALLYRRSRVIFQNRQDRELFIESGLVRRELTHIIPGSGVDPDEFKAVPEPSGEPIILLASRMLWDKGVGELVEAMRLIRQQGVACRAILVGRSDKGNPSAIPEAQLETWNEEGVVEWWGHRDDMPAVMQNVHLVVLPTYGEGLPKVLIEACAAGRPVVASDVPGCREIVQDGVNGLLVPCRDVQTLAKALIRLVRDPALRERMGRAGRELVLSRLTNQHINDQTLHVYRELLESQSVGS